MWNARLDEAQAGIKIARRNINNLIYADDTTLMSESREELKSLLMKVKEESEKAGLILNIQKMKIMASGPITSWQINEKTMETMTLYFPGLQNHRRWWLQPWIKRHLLLGRKAMTNLDSILKSRRYFANKSLYSQRFGFSSSHIWMCELDHKEAWVPKNWCFWTVVSWESLWLQGDQISQF